MGEGSINDQWSDVLPITRKALSFEGHFTQIPNSVLRDESLSYKALGLLCHLMSHAPGWVIRREDMLRPGAGEAAVRGAVRELEEAGWLSVARDRDDLGRHMVFYDLTVPSTFENQRWSTCDNRTPKNTRDIYTSKDTTSSNTSNRAREEKFDAFWAAYPRKVSKGSARTAWRSAVKKVDPDVIVAAVEAWAPSQAGKEAKFIPHASTWLNGERWADEVEAGPADECAAMLDEFIVKGSLAGVGDLTGVRWSDRDVRAAGFAGVDESPREAHEARVEFLKSRRDELVAALG